MCSRPYHQAHAMFTQTNSSPNGAFVKYRLMLVCVHICTQVYVPHHPCATRLSGYRVFPLSQEVPRALLHSRHNLDSDPLATCQLCPVGLMYTSPAGCRFTCLTSSFCNRHCKVELQKLDFSLQRISPHLQHRTNTPHPHPKRSDR